MDYVELKTEPMPPNVANMDTHSSGDNQGRLLDLLDQAYDVSSDDDSFETMIDAARAYFFETPSNDTLAPSVPRYAGLNPHLEKHIPRLEKMMVRGKSKHRTGLSLAQHAQMKIGEHGRILGMNTHAQALLGSRAGQSYETLNLTWDSHKTLKDLTGQLSGTAAPIQKIIYLQTADDVPVNNFAYCRSAQDTHGANILHINLSQFEWTETLFRHLEKALGLSKSEGYVLRGTLQGLAQKDIAAARGRSLDTVKTQAKAVLRKTGCAKMGDIVHLCTSIAYVMSLSQSSDTASTVKEAWTVPQTNMAALELPGGRQLTYYEYGPPDDRPCLFIHGFMQGPFFTQNMLRDFQSQKLRIIAPCRPGFGLSAQSLTRRGYNQSVISDTEHLLRHLGVATALPLITHQGGVSHAFRIAKALEDQITSMIMVGAGIPITQEHITHMDRQTQLAAVATRHAPSIMKLTLSMGIKTYERKGVRAFLERQFENTPPDLRSLNNPELLQIQKWGCYFLAGQGTETFIRDGGAAMTDWSHDFSAVTCQQHWIHGRSCPVMGAKFVKDYITANTNYPVDILEDTGFNILHQRSKEIIALIANVV